MKSIVYYCERNRTDMTKTIREWFDELPEPQRSQAIENCDVEDLDLLVDSLLNACLGAFNWKKSPQGHGYWDSIYEELIAKELNQSQP